MQEPPSGAQIPQLGLQQNWPAPQLFAPQGTPASGTQAQTEGELSKWNPLRQSTVSTQAQMPPQSAPPLRGSQSSLGSSTHLPPPGQGMPAIPPQAGPQAPSWPMDTPATDAWHPLE